MAAASPALRATFMINAARMLTIKWPIFIENAARSSHEFFDFTISLRLSVTVPGNQDGCPG
jgi:hypothetical protein